MQRLALFLLSVFVFTFSAAAEPPEPAKPKTPSARQLFKPELFETLVNPNCSHCVDEARRRASELRGDDRVLAWTRGKYEGGAVPWRFFLVPYRVISDTYGVFVYDADAGFVRGYEPSLDFRFHGWRNGVMVIRHKDGTLFSALSGRAFDGPRKGEQLKPIATLETDWGDWSRAYPGSVAYHMFDKYQPLEPPERENADSVATRLAADPQGVDGRTRVIGLALGERAKAWPLAALEAAGGVVEDELDGQKLLVLWQPATQTAAIYSPEVEDAPDELPSVSLVREDTDEHAAFRDRTSGSRFGIEGRAASGPLKGKTLRWLPGVQCRWFAWAAEYPKTELHPGPRDTAPPAAKKPQPGRRETSQNSTSDAAPAEKTPPEKAPPEKAPLSAVIAGPEAVTPEQAARWRREGFQAAAVVLDEGRDAAEYRRAARTLADAKLELYYWIEVARNVELADAHPEWMASLGMHDDWLKRFPETPAPKPGQVAKAYPWVPIGYRPTYDAHLQRIARLLERAAGDYRGLLVNDLQGGPASCGCGNLQCRWAIDYGVASTAEKLPGDDAAARFTADVRKLAPGKQVTPVWMTECEDRDLPADRRPQGRSTGYCGGVGCSQGTCPKAFTKQFAALAGAVRGPIALAATHRELRREGAEYGGPAGWVGQTVDYLDETLPKHGGEKLPRERLWLVVQGYDLPPETVAAAREAAAATGAGAVFVAQTPIEQTYEPRVIAVESGAAEGGAADDLQPLSREVSSEGVEYLAKLRKRTPFGSTSFDLEGLRKGMGSRREPADKEVKLVPVKVGEIPCEWVVAPGADAGVRLLYLHGGGFVSGSGGYYLALAAHLSAAAKCAVLLPDYRLAPEHPFPAGLDDCVAAHEWITSHGPFAAEAAKATFIAGDSAGGNLTLATLLALRDRGMKPPAGGIPISPTTDFTLASDSLKSVDDPIISAKTMPIFREHYLGETDPRNPLASPVFGDYRGMPPLLFELGEHEMLRDDSVRAAQKARAAGLDVRLEIWPGMFHVFQSHEPLLPEARESIEQMAKFMRSKIAGE